MKIVSAKDFLEVKLGSLIGDYDRDTIMNLYQPIIGYTACSVYFSLWTEANNQKIVSLITHETFYNRLQMSPGTFIDARNKLEAVGLLRTYLVNTFEAKIYHYELYSPKTPKKFFDHTLLFGLLIKNLGEREADQLKSIYEKTENLEKGEEITVKFNDVFNTDLNDPAFTKALNSENLVFERTSSKIKGEFTYETFFAALSKISNLTSDAFNRKDMKEIERLSLLYGLDESVAAQRVRDVFDPNQEKGKRIDFEKLKLFYQEDTNHLVISSKIGSESRSLNSSKSDLGAKINQMETKSPREYLSLLQNGTNPASGDLAIVDSLSANFGLPNSVINALVDYVLFTNNNVLKRAYIEKIAASLAREGAKTALDAMNYLKKVNKGKTNPVAVEKKSYIATTRAYKAKEEIKQTKPLESKSKAIEEKDIDVDWATLMSDFDEDGGSDGKA